MTKVKKSAIVAFIELLKSVDEGEEVLLLRSSDVCAKEAIQYYNDAVHEDDYKDVPKEYITFTDKLAGVFAAVTEVYQPNVAIPEGEGLKSIAKMLVQLRNKVLSEA